MKRVRLFRQLGCFGCAFALFLSLAGMAHAALSGSTERIRDMIAKHDFPGSEPVMDPQQQFIVFSPDQRLSKEVLDLVLSLRQQTYGFFGISKISDQPAFVLIFPTKERYGLQGTGGATMQFKYRNQYVRLLASYLQEKLKEEILPHEMVHFLIADMSALGTGAEGKPPELPIFINEGIAEYFSASAGKRVLFEKMLWEAYQAGKLEPFKGIVTSTGNWAEALTPGQSAWVQRAQGYSVVSFLASLPNGNVKLRNYIVSFATTAGRVAREEASLRAFEMAFGRDFPSWEDLQNRWVNFIREREIVVLEAESASVTDSSGEKWEVRKYPRERLWLSGEKELVFHAEKPGSFVTLQADLNRPGAFDVYGIYTQGQTHGRFKLAINGREFPVLFDGYERREELCEPFPHGKTLVGPGAISAQFSVADKVTISGGYDIGIDCLLLRRDSRLEEQHRASAQRFVQTGVNNYQRKQFREAEENFTRALDLLPGDVAALEWRAYARMALGRPDEAEEDVNAAVKLAPRSPRFEQLKKQLEASKSRKNEQ
ncbi:MAG: tetratricopeptide repeat protein [bacterium]|nr:tetratricopeptide repeat protein [bacterium]